MLALLLENLAEAIIEGVEPKQAVRNYTSNAALADLAALATEVFGAGSQRTMADLERRLVAELEAAILEAAECNGPATSSACDRETWCCRQVGHEGACDSNFT